MATKRAEAASLSRIATNLIGRKTRVYFINAMDGAGGYTSAPDNEKDPIEIHIVYDDEIIQNLPEKYRPMYRKGVCAHEILHQLLTDFQYTMEVGSSFPNRFEQGVFMKFMNTLEDPAIEYFAPNEMGGALLKSLRYMIDTAYYFAPRLDEVETDPFTELINAMIEFGDKGIIKGHFQSAEAEKYFKLIAPKYNEGITCPNSRRRIDIALECMEMTRPLWEPLEALEKLREELEKALEQAVKSSGAHARKNEESSMSGSDSEASERRSKVVRKIVKETEDEKDAREKTKSDGKSEDETSEDKEAGSSSAAGTHVSGKAAKKDEEEAETDDKSGSDSSDSDDEGEDTEEEKDDKSGSDSESETEKDSSDETDGTSEKKESSESEENISDDVSEEETSEGSESTKEGTDEKSGDESDETGDDSDGTDENSESRSDSKDEDEDADSKSEDEDEDGTPGSDDVSDSDSDDGSGSDESDEDETESGSEGDGSSESESHSDSDKELKHVEHDSGASGPDSEDPYEDMFSDDNPEEFDEIEPDDSDVEALEKELDEEERKLSEEDRREAEAASSDKCDPMEIVDTVVGKAFVYNHEANWNERNASVYNSVVQHYRRNITQLTRSLKHIFEAEQEEVRWSSSGNYNILRGSSGTTSKIFDRRKDPGNAYDAAVMLLIDLSGSMIRNDRIITARDTAIVFAEALSTLKIPFYVMGFAADMDGGETATHTHFVGWHDTRKERETLGGMHQGFNNFDGASIRAAAGILQKKNASRKLLLVISDGLPECYAYEGRNGIVDTRAAIREANRIAPVFGIALGDDCPPEMLKEMYDKQLVHTSESRLMFTLTRKLEDYFRNR